MAKLILNEVFSAAWETPRLFFSPLVGAVRGACTAARSTYETFRPTQ